MTRTLTAGALAEVQKQKTRPVLFVELDFVSGFVRRWAGIGQITWDGKTWQGSGTLGKVSPVEETDEIRAAGLTFEMSGIPAADLATALTEIYQGRAASMWLGFLDANNVVIVDPTLLWGAKMDVMEIDEGPETSVIRVQTESRLAALKRPKVRRLTKEDLQIDFPGDKGFYFIAALQDQQLVF